MSSIPDTNPTQAAPEVDRQSMDVDIACVGFGPAMGGFLTTLSRALVNEDGTYLAESAAMPGMPLQVLCYERADDPGFGVSGVVTRGRSIRESFPDLDLSQIPMAAKVGTEKVVHLMDPVGASRRSTALRMAEGLMRSLKGVIDYRDHAVELPYIPGFLRKHDGMVLSIGQFNQWVAAQAMGSGMVQVWPSMPVSAPLVEDGRVVGIRLTDQGTDKKGNPEAGYMPGMDIKAALTVVGDGPVGAVGRELDRRFGLPGSNHQRDWAVGMKMVVDLPDNCTLEPGTVLHTLGYPEPEIFGFLYVYPERVASLGIFVPSWFDSPIRTAYRYLQHWIMHPYLWKHLEGGTMRSWGAKSLQESGLAGEPHLVGDGYARIGEGSGSTNVLTGSGVDEAWATGVMLAQGVIELLREGKPFTRENLDAAYVQRRRKSWVQEEGRIARNARNGFQTGVIPGLMGMALAGLTRGTLAWPGQIKRTWERIPSVEEYFHGRIPVREIELIRQECTAKGRNLHDALMDRAGWPSVPYDGKLLVSHQDALLLGGKVQAPSGYKDHVVFVDPGTCERCRTKTCIEACSGQAITTNPEGGIPLFDREKCIHCGACLWNCSRPNPKDLERTNIEFIAGAGGLHSAEN
jgi:electron-transferring-flavoprotein dehydrogenase